MQCARLWGADLPPASRMFCVHAPVSKRPGQELLCDHAGIAFPACSPRKYSSHIRALCTCWHLSRNRSATHTVAHTHIMSACAGDRARTGSRCSQMHPHIWQVWVLMEECVGTHGVWVLMEDRGTCVIVRARVCSRAPGHVLMCALSSNCAS